MDNLNNQKSSLIVFILLAFSIIGYAYISYGVKRTDSLPLIAVYTMLFVIYLYSAGRLNSELDIKKALLVAIGIRAVTFFSLPSLSDDFYRFIWDGRLLNNGVNPFSHLPTYYFENGKLAINGLDQQLYHSLNSPNYFTIYPPVNQLVFWISANISPRSIFGSVSIIRAFIFLSEIATMYIMTQLLSLYNLPKKRVLLYALNPLVVLELTGNLHFEGVLLLFVLLGIYFLKKNNWIVAAFFFAAAISTKLLPLMFMPFIFSQLSFKKNILFYILTGLLVLLSFLPIINADFLHGFTTSFALYFKTFEFNGSIYKIIRWLGYILVGYNVIGAVGGYLGLLVFVLIIHYAFFENLVSKNILPHSFLWALTIYLAFATTVHPWYIIPLLAYSLFTGYRYVVIWSFLIFFTYLNYDQNGVTEYALIGLIEYGLVVILLLMELKNSQFLKKIPRLYH